MSHDQAVLERFDRFLARNKVTHKPSTLELEALTRSFAELNSLCPDELYELRLRVYHRAAS